MVCSKQASLDAFLSEQPAADDANVNEELEVKSIMCLCKRLSLKVRYVGF